MIDGELIVRARRNDRLLGALPTGLVCVASHQIAGRGRGANSWVSPAGCLQFSLVLRLSTGQASRIVFIQYLFGLAVVEAIRGVKGYEQLGIVLKWPNDIYADLGSEGETRYKKIGGILVNSSYAGSDFTLVVGESSLLLLGAILISKLKVAASTRAIPDRQPR